MASISSISRTGRAGRNLSLLYSQEFDPDDENDLGKRRLREDRKKSFLQAQMLENEHKKARAMMALSPQEKEHYINHEARLDQSCERLYGLMKRLKLDASINMFRKRRITYERAKKMTAREFASLGVSHNDSLRLANTLSYASAVQQSYRDIGATSTTIENTLEDINPSPVPKLFPRGHYDIISPIPVKAIEDENRGIKSPRRLSSMGRDLLGVFDRTKNSVPKTSEGIKHPNVKYL